MNIPLPRTVVVLAFVAPAKVQLKAEKRQIVYTKTYSRGQGQLPAPGIYASGADVKDGRFFVIATIHRGTPPPVKVQGNGLGAKASVGRRTISFDGEKIILGG